MPLIVLNGHGHFYSVLISFIREVLYKNIEKHQNFKGKLYKFFLY